MSGTTSMKRPLPPPDNFDDHFRQVQRAKLHSFTEAHCASVALAKRLELEEAASAKKRDVANFNKSTVAQQEAKHAAFLEGVRKEEQEKAEKKKIQDAEEKASSMELIAKEMRHCSD